MEEMQDLLDGLRRAPNILAALVKSIPADKLDVRRGEGFWTIAEHVSHLAQVQPMLLERFERFVNEDHPVFTPYIPGEDEEESEAPERMEMTAALEQFALYRQRQLALLAGADQRTWRKTAIHPEYDAYSFLILVRHLLLHDHWHMYRMEELWLTKEAYLTKVE